MTVSSHEGMTASKTRRWRGSSVSVLVISVAISIVLAVYVSLLRTITEETKLLTGTAIILIETIVFLAVDSWETGRRLDSVADRLSTISTRMGSVVADIERRNRLYPRVTARFLTDTKMQTALTIPSSSKSTVDIALGNDGSMSALNARWQLFFRATLGAKAVEGSDLPKVLTKVQPAFGYYPGDTSLKYPETGTVEMVGPKSSEVVIRIELTPTAPPGSKIPIPVNGQCTNQPQEVTQLEIMVA